MSAHFDFNTFAPFNSESTFSTNSTGDLPTRLYSSIKKDDFISNFWTPLPNFETMEKELGDIDKEIKNFNKTKETIGEYEYLISLKAKLGDNLDNMKKIIDERNKGREQIEKACDSLEKQADFFNSNSALLTTDPKDIEINNKWKNDISKFRNELMNYKNYVINKVDTDNTKVNYTTQKYEVVYNNIVAMLTKIHQEIYQIHYKHKMPKTNIFCTVCLEKGSTHVSVPCGHIFCEDCSIKMKNKCASCRNPVEKIIKLYNLDEVNANTGETLQDNTAQPQSNTIGNLAISLITGFPIAFPSFSA